MAGASTGRIKVCYDSYFEHRCIRQEIEATITNFDEIINKRYSPSEIVKLLIKLNIIGNESDLEKLGIDDIIFLRRQSCFTKFIKKFDEYSSRSNFDELISRKKESSKIIIQAKSAIISVLLTSVFTITSVLLKLGMVNSLKLSILSLIVIYILTYLWRTKCKYEIPGIEKVLDKIIGFFDPVSLYLAKIKWRLDIDK